MLQRSPMTSTRLRAMTRSTRSLAPRSTRLVARIRRTLVHLIFAVAVRIRQGNGTRISRCMRFATRRPARLLATPRTGRTRSVSWMTTRTRWTRRRPVTRRSRLSLTRIRRQRTRRSRSGRRSGRVIMRRTLMSVVTRWSRRSRMARTRGGARCQVTGLLSCLTRTITRARLKRRVAPRNEARITTRSRIRMLLRRLISRQRVSLMRLSTRLI